MYIILDLETTSLKPNQGAIIEIALLKIKEEGKIVEEYQTLINPQTPLPPQVTALTQIKEKELKQAPSFAQVREKIKKFIGDHPLVGHNINFDLEFLKYQGLDLSTHKKIDTWIIFSVLYPTLASTNLEYLAQYFQLKVSPSHRAMADAKTTLALFLKAKKEFLHLSPILRKKIIKVLKKTDWHGKDSLWGLLSIMSQSSTPSSVLPPPLPLHPESHPPLSSPKGERELLRILSRLFTKKEQWMVETKKGLNEAEIIASFLAQQKTKIKTLLFFSRKRARENFIKLYSQITSNRDATSLLAQEEYLCQRKLNEFLKQKKITREHAPPFLKVLVWQENTQRGEIEEVKFIKDEYKIKELFVEDGFSCLKEKCAFHKECYFFKALKLAQKRRVIFSSHHLLVQDLKKHFAPLKLSQSAFIIQQAEELEKNITQSLTQKINLRLFLKKIQSLIKTTTDKELLPLLNKLQRQIQKMVETAQNFFTEQEILEYNQSLSLKPPLQEKLQRIKYKTSWKKLKRLLREKKTLSSLEILRISEILKDLKNLKSFLSPCSTKISWLVRTNQAEMLFNTAPLKLEIKNLPPRTLFISPNLTTNKDDFSYLERTLNLTDLRKKSLTTLIDYTQASRIFLLQDIPPSSLGKEEFLIRVIRKVLKKIPQKTMVILQNYTALQRLLQKILPLLDNKTLLLAQGSSGGENKVFSQFQQDKQILLLGTHTYLERLNIEDPRLKCIILNKLSFDYLSDPLISARQSSFQDGFKEYILPRAILRFKKLFNRLISYPQDQGLLILLDERLWIKKYGQQFLGLVPPQVIRRINLANLSQEIDKFFKN